MTIIQLQNTTNIYRVDAKKLGGERGYLVLKDLWIKFKFPRSNMSILEVVRSRESKNPKGRRKKRRKPRLGKGAAILKSITAPQILAPCMAPKTTAPC
jgi:hypothetical protein